VGPSFEGDIAIDDVYVTPGECRSFGSCDFENNDYCSWSNVKDKRDVFDWELGMGPTSSSFTGPT